MTTAQTSQFAALHQDRHGSIPIASRSSPYRNQGFNLIELMMVVTIAAIAMGIATPMIQDWSGKRTMDAEYRSLREGLSSARDIASAAKEGYTTATICSSSDGASCTGSAWNNGWIIFGDLDADASVDVADKIFAVQDALDSNTSITLTLADGSGGPSAITFYNNGTTMRSFKDASAQMMVFTYCNAQAGSSTVRGVVLQPGGGSRMAVDTDDNNIPNFATGDLTCP